MTHLRPYLSLRCDYSMAWAFILTQLWLPELLARSRKGALGNSIPFQQKDHRFLQVGQVQDSGRGMGRLDRLARPEKDSTLFCVRVSTLKCSVT